MFHDVARKVVRRRFAFRLPPWPALGFRLRCRWAGLWSRGRGLRLVLLEIAEDQMQLIDRISQLLRRRSEPLPQQLRQPGLQWFDFESLVYQSVPRGFEFGRVCFLARQQQRPQSGGALRQLSRIER